MTTLIIVALFLCIAGYIASSIICKKMYKDHGIDLKSGVGRRLDMIMSAVGLIMMLADHSTLFIGLLMLIVGLAILVILNLKAKNIGITIALSISQVFAGLVILVVFVLRLGIAIGPFLSGLVLGGSSSSSLNFTGAFNYLFGSSSTGETLASEVNNELNNSRDNANNSYRATEDERNERAEAYAQSQGFSSADEAEEYGIKTGK